MGPGTNVLLRIVSALEPFWLEHLPREVLHVLRGYLVLVDEDRSLLEDV